MTLQPTATQTGPSQPPIPARREPAPEPLDRVPPHDIEAEMAVLGAMMLDREIVPDVLNVLTREDAGRFYRIDHRKIFEVLIDLYDRSEPIDLISTKNEFRRREALDSVGGEDYLVMLAESVPHTANAEYYARVVRDKSYLRDLITCAGQIMHSAYGDREDAREVLDAAERDLFTVTEQRVAGRPEPFHAYLDQVFAQLEAREGAFLSGLSTGFLELDDLTSGFQNGEMIIIAARPSIGKTALALGIALHMAGRNNLPVGFFSLETSKLQIAMRALCGWGQVDSHKLRRGMLNDMEIAKLQQVCDELKHFPLFVDDTPGMTVLEFRAKARRLRLQHEIAAVFVDYLQLMENPRSENRQQEISFISRGLKALARELNIPVVACAQLNRQPEGREGHRPRMSDLRESGAIEQDADVVLLLHREEIYRPHEESLRGLAELIVAKQRNGPIGNVQLQFNSRYSRFNNLSVAPEPAVWSAEAPPPDTLDETPF